MNSVHIHEGRAAAAKLRLFLRRHPEWWTFALCCSAWTLMLLESWRHFGHGAHHRMSFAQELLGWMMMVAAMMLPLAKYAIHTVAVDTTIGARRHRAVA